MASQDACSLQIGTVTQSLRQGADDVERASSADELGSSDDTDPGPPRKKRREGVGSVVGRVDPETAASRDMPAMVTASGPGSGATPALVPAHTAAPATTGPTQSTAAIGNTENTTPAAAAAALVPAPCDTAAPATTSPTQSTAAIGHTESTTPAAAAAAAIGHTESTAAAVPLQEVPPAQVPAVPSATVPAPVDTLSAQLLSRVLSHCQMAAEYEHRLLALTPESVLKCEQLMNQTAIHRSPDGQGGQNDFFLAIVLKDTTAPPADSVVIRYCAFGSCNQTDMIHQFASACAQKLKQINQPPDHQPSQLAANGSALNIRLICAGNDAGVVEAKKRIAEKQERIAEARGQQDATGDPLNTSASSTQQKKTRSRAPSTATLQSKWTKMFKKMFSAQGDGAQLFVMGAIVLQRSRIHWGQGRAVVKPFSLGVGAVQNLSTDFMSETAYGLFCGSTPVADDAPHPSHCLNGTIPKCRGVSRN